MKPAPFEYLDPGTVAEAVTLLSEHEEDAKVLAGGQSLLPVMNMRLARPGLIVDLNRVPGLDYIREENGFLRIGAMTRQRDVEFSDLVKQRNPLLHAATCLIGHPQIRNRGTIGGSIAHADPAAEDPAVALALGAEVVALGPGGERTIPASDFFVTYLTTALEPSEVLTELRIPVLPETTGWAITEIARRHGDLALAGAVVLLSAEEGKLSGATIVVYGVDATPVEAREAEEMLLGEKPSESLFKAASERAGAAIEEPTEDIHASADFRRQLARVMVRRALAEAATRVAIQG